MTFLKKRINWKRVRPINLRDALRQCKEHARIKKNLSVERIAELMGISEDLLYKWLSNGKMPAPMIPVYENICGIHFVSEYLASTANRMVIDIPTGKKATNMDISELQASLAEATSMLIKYYNGEADLDEVQDELLHGLKGLAYHRENVEKVEQPELELEQ